MGKYFTSIIEAEKNRLGLKVEVKCQRCGQVRVVEQKSFRKFASRNKGKFLCLRCAMQVYNKSKDHYRTAAYISLDREDKVIEELRLRKIILLNKPRTKRGGFPKRRDNKIHFKLKCKVCGREWYSTSNRLIAHQIGCPSCGQKRRKDALEKYYARRREEFTVDTINDRLKEIHIWMDPSSYGGKVLAKKLCEFTCLECGYKWKDHLRAYLYDHKKCPKCSGKRRVRKSKNKINKGESK